MLATRFGECDRMIPLHLRSLTNILQHPRYEDSWYFVVDKPEEPEEKPEEEKPEEK
jgi:hypothetical protein